MLQIQLLGWILVQNTLLPNFGYFDPSSNQVLNPVAVRTIHFLKILGLHSGDFGSLMLASHMEGFLAKAVRNLEVEDA
jgi:hypothetical protein